MTEPCTYVEDESFRLRRSKCKGIDAGIYLAHINIRRHLMGRIKTLGIYFLSNVMPEEPEEAVILNKRFL